MHGTKGPGWAALSRPRPIPQAALWQTLVTVGLRAGEAMAATWADYDDAERLTCLGVRSNR